MYKVEVYVAKSYIEEIITAVTKLGGCKVGDYDYVASYYPIEGCFRPLEHAKPHTGNVGEIYYGSEYKLELRVDEALIKSALYVIKEIHPYEEPLINIIKLDNDKFNLN